MRIDEIERIDEILPVVAAAGGIAARVGATAARALGGLAKTAVKTAAKGVQAVGKAASGAARTVGKTAGKQVGRRIGAGRNPVQDRGTGSAFSGNPPKQSLGSIGAMPGANTSSVGSTERPGTKGTIGTTPPQSAADMRNSASNFTSSTGTTNMQNTQSNTVEPVELKNGDKLGVELDGKNVKLIYPDETEAEVPLDILNALRTQLEPQLERLQQLAGNANET